MIHELTLRSDKFEAIHSGKKSYIITDAGSKQRQYKEGDMLAFNEYDKDCKAYTGNSMVVYVDYIEYDAAVEEGCICLGFKPCVVCLKTEPFDRCKLAHDYSVPYATKGDGVK